MLHADAVMYGCFWNSYESTAQLYRLTRKRSDTNELLSPTVVLVPAVRYTAIEDQTHCFQKKNTVGLMISKKDYTCIKLMKYVMKKGPHLCHSLLWKLNVFKHFNSWSIQWTGRFVKMFCHCVQDSNFFIQKYWPYQCEDITVKSLYANSGRIGMKISQSTVLTPLLHPAVWRTVSLSAVYTPNRGALVWERHYLDRPLQRAIHHIPLYTPAPQSHTPMRHSLSAVIHQRQAHQYENLAASCSYTSARPPGCIRTALLRTCLYIAQRTSIEESCLISPVYTKLKFICSRISNIQNSHLSILRRNKRNNNFFMWSST